MHQGHPRERHWGEEQNFRHRVSQELRKRRLIETTSHGRYQTYSIVGLVAKSPSEPPKLSTQGKLLTFLRHKCARDGTYCFGPPSHREGKSGWSVRPTIDNIAKLRTAGLIDVTRGVGIHPNTRKRVHRRRAGYEGCPARQTRKVPARQRK